MFMLFLSSADFFKLIFFKHFNQENFQSVKWFGSRVSVLSWVQTVCKSYQQTSKFAAKKYKKK